MTSISVQGRKTKKSFIECSVELIRHEKVRQGLSFSQLASRAEVGRPYLHRVLNGEQTPTFEWIESVLSQLGIEIEVEFSNKKSV